MWDGDGGHVYGSPINVVAAPFDQHAAVLLQQALLYIGSNVFDDPQNLATLAQAFAMSKHMSQHMPETR